MTTEYKLPKAQLKEWEPIVRTSRQIPFGYSVDPEDKWVLLPISDELDLLEQAKQHLKQYSYRAVADWLSEKSGRPITHSGLRQRVISERRKTRKSTNLEQLAKKYQKTLEKIQELEKRKLGKHSDFNSTSNCDSSGD
jgi:hypothetical protein